MLNPRWWARPIPRFRFTLRWMMVGVAITALAIIVGRWGAEMIRISRGHERWAMRHGIVERYAVEAAAKEAAHRPELTAKAAHHASMRQKYERAARYPWLAVEPDPPGPD
jgi:hypothetical protein